MAQFIQSTPDKRTTSGASIDIGVRFDGKDLEKQILQAFKNTGARVVL